MPNWSIRGDWPYELDIDLVSVPLDCDGDGTLIEKDSYTITLNKDDPRRKTLVIDIQSSCEVPVLAILPGSVTCPDTNTIMLITDVFSVAGISRILSESPSISLEEPLPPSRLSTFPIRWFYSWIERGRIPKKIIYENIVDRICSDGDQNVRAGDVIGRAGSHPSNSTKKQIKIKIEYQDSADTDQKFMHPSEFFGLLFWQEESDPAFRESPMHYSPLLQKMMESRENGEFGTCCDDDWLGLRPPLRTFIRVEWEARVAHMCHHYNWQRLPTDSGEAARLREAHGNDYGDLTGLKRNPLIVDYPYVRASKCNIFAGEMAFRAGFRVFTYISGSGLAYLTGNSLVRPCTSASDDGEKILSRSSSATISYRTKTYRIGNNIPRGKKRFVTSSNVDQIGIEINLEGKAIIHTRKAYCRARTGSGHVSYSGGTCPGGPSTDPRDGPEDSLTHRHQAFHIVFLSMLLRVFPNNIEATIIDQHNSPPHETVCFARDSTIADVGCKDSSERAFIELIPGGDPTEEWGVVDLNCLEEVP